MATTTGSKRLLNISSDAMAASNSMTYGGLNVATEQYVSTQVSNLVASAPGTLDTLNELAAALGDDPNFATTIANSIATKLDASVNPIKAASVSNDTITFTRADNTTFSITTSDANTDTNYYLNGITRSGNTLTFSVSGATNQTYTFGSAAWSATTAFDAAGSAGAVNTRIDDEIIPLINGKADASHTHSYLPLAGGTITGALTVSGSTTRGTYDSASQYHTGADNIVLKGNASGISSIFFESEKNGTNINHPSDFGFIQYHPYGTSTSGESNELIIGVSNDADDHLVLNAPNVNGLKFRIGSSATDYTVWHSGNFNPADKADASHNHSGTYLGVNDKAADSDLLDGINSTGFVRQLGDTTSPDYQNPSSRRVDPNTGNPTNEHYAITTFGNGGNVTGQLATHFQNGQSYLRAYNSSWSGWRKIWDDTNFNPSDYLTTSGKAADSNLLDGINSTSFLRSDQADTMSGTLTITGSSGASRLRIEGTTPTIDLDDSDGDSFYIHVNSNNFYILADRDGAGNYGDWDGSHPLQLEGDTNKAYIFGNEVKSAAYAATSAFDAAGTGAAQAGAVNDRIDQEVLPLIDTKQDAGSYAAASHNHSGLYIEGIDFARQLGWVPAYGSSVEANVDYDFQEEAIKIKNPTDSSTGAAYKAIRVKSGDKVRFSIMLKASVAVASGLYVRLYQVDGDLPNGKTHVSNSAGSSHPFVVEDTRGITNWVENAALGTSWTNYEYTYTAAADGYVSLVVLNWDGAGVNVIYAQQPDIQFEKVSDSSKLNGQAASYYLDYGNFTDTPTIPSGNQIIDWTVDQGSTNIHSGNYTNTTYTAGTGLSLSGTEFSVTANTYAPASHTHAIDEVDGLQVELDAKAPLSHNHTSLNLTGSIYNGSANYSIDLRDHSDGTWLRNEVGRWTFQRGTSGDDWTQSFTFYLPSAGSTANNVWAELGQRDSNDVAAGRYRGLRIVKDTGSVADGDLRAGAIYIGTTRRDANWTEAYNWGNHAGAGYALASSLPGDYVGGTGLTTDSGLVPGTTIPSEERPNYYMDANGNWKLFSYTSLFNTPTLGTAAAADVGDFAAATHTHSYDNYGEWYISGEADSTDVTSGKWVKFVGAASITGTGAEADPYLIDLSDSYAAASHSHSYLPLSGGTLTGDLTVSGNQVITADSNADVKFSVWSGTTYGIGMTSGVTYGGLNDYAMTFCMNNDSDRGFWWGYSGQTKSSGAMSLTTAGVLTVASSITAGGDITAFSDIRVKENIKDLENSLDKVTQLRGVSYNKIGSEEKSIGVIAQEIQEVLPEVVREGQDGMLSVAYGNITAVLIEAIKEQQEIISQLEERIVDLENRM